MVPNSQVLKRSASVGKSRFRAPYSLKESPRKKKKRRGLRKGVSKSHRSATNLVIIEVEKLASQKRNYEKSMIEEYKKLTKLNFREPAVWYDADKGNKTVKQNYLHYLKLRENLKSILGDDVYSRL